ncbi:MAG: hypothetical protein DRI46_06610 [Chloroflexi bacterium]|nr:MAG: hypothetical protein DRI46_06610 [Chloroflexota bacterium]
MKETKYISGEMNLDVSSELTGEKDYTAAQNIVIGKSFTGQAGAIEPLRSSVQLNIGSVYSDDVNIGMCVSRDNKKVYLFMYNPVPVRNRIIEYDHANNFEVVILTSDLLEFDINKPIINALEIGGYLYFVDGSLEAKCVSTTKWVSDTPAIEDIAIGKRPMAHAPIFIKYEDSVTLDEDLPDMLGGYDFQFATQYAYDDNKESVISPISRLALSNFPYDTYRRIRILFPIFGLEVEATVLDVDTGYVFSGYDNGGGLLSDRERTPISVEKINVLARTGNTGAWNIVDVIERGPGGLFERNFSDFYNNTNGVAVPDRYEIPFDLIPRSPMAQELANDRMFYANYFEGYDVPSIDITAEYVKSDVTEDGTITVNTQVYEQSARQLMQVDDSDLCMDIGYGRSFEVIGNSFGFHVMIDIPGSGPAYRYLNIDDFKQLLGTDVTIAYAWDSGSSQARLNFSGTFDLSAVQVGDYIAAPTSLFVKFYQSNSETQFICDDSLDPFTYMAKVLSVDIPNNRIIIDTLGNSYSRTSYQICHNVADPYFITPSAIMAHDLHTVYDQVVPYGLMGGGCETQCIIQFGLVWKATGNADTESEALGSTLGKVDASVAGDLSDLAGLKAFSSNSSYRLGIVFKDAFLRAGGVITGPDAVVDIIGTEYIFNANIQWNIPGEQGDLIPDWAKYYSIVRTINLKKTTFIEYHTADIYYLGVATDGTISVESYVYDADNQQTIVDISNLISAGKGYSFLEGDRIILFNVQNKDGVGDPEGVTVDLPIEVQEDGTKIILPNIDLTQATELLQYQAVRYEIYRPRKDPFDSIFYEVGHTYNIDRSSGDPLFSVPSGILEGDTVNVVRNKYIKTAPDGDIIIDAAQKQTLYRAISAQDDNPLALWNTNIGHAFIIDTIGEVYKGRYFRWSNQVIQDTKVNGLNEFNALNDKAVPEENGIIVALRLTTKVQAEGTIMLAISERRPASIYLGEQQWVDSEGSSVAALTYKDVGSIRTQANDYGCMDPESVIAIRGRVYWYDRIHNEFCEYSVSGTRSISELKTSTHFKKIVDSDTNNIVSFYDPYYKVLFITAREYNGGFSQRTIGYDVLLGKWRAHYDVDALYGAYVGDAMYLTERNKLWRFDDASPSHNRFFGTQFVSSIKLSFNEQASTPKEWNSIAIQCSANMIDYSQMPPSVGDVGFKVIFTNKDGQYSDLLHGDFDADNFIIYSDILFDENSDGGLLEGSKMSSNTLEAEIIVGRSQLFQLYFIEVGYILTKGHNIT